MAIIANQGDSLRTTSGVGVVATSAEASAHSGVSWGAIFAGAAAAAALSLILLLLGTGLGFSAASPFASQGVSATTLGVAGIIWITLTQLIASGMGGYLAGRLRTKWVGVHTDEVYFRDTAHGFLAWAVSALVSAALLTSVIGSIVGGTVQAGASVAGGAVSAATATLGGAAVAGAKGADDSGSGSAGYFIDSLFRKAANDANATPGAVAPGGAAPSIADPKSAGQTTAEVGRIFANAVRTGAMPPEDVRYVGQLVSQQTGLSQQDAEKRVSETYAKAQQTVADAKVAAKEAADTARKASAYVALWLFISMLIGAFGASFAATLGGRQRDL